MGELEESGLGLFQGAIMAFALEELKKTTKTQSQDSQEPKRDFKSV
jgi:hypothetical protein